MELQSRLGELRAKGLSLAAISYDPPEVLSDFARRRGITFPLLSDSASDTIKRFGILNTTVPATASIGTVRITGVPYPGTFIVNRQGMVTMRDFKEAYQERTTASTLLLKAGGQTLSGTRQATDYLEVVTSVSDAAVSPGTIFSLVLDIKPSRNIHIYAPGVTGYKPIALRLEQRPGLKVRELEFPKSEIYHFKPLNERVPVYQKPFRLLQEVNIELSSAGQALARGSDQLVIKGFLDYQACSDKVCFLPQSLPVEWKVKIQPLDIERSRVQR